MTAARTQRITSSPPSGSVRVRDEAELDDLGFAVRGDLLFERQRAAGVVAHPHLEPPRLRPASFWLFWHTLSTITFSPFFSVPLPMWASNGSPWWYSSRPKSLLAVQEDLAPTLCS